MADQGTIGAGEAEAGKAPLFQLWMVANLAVGMGQFAFIPLLVVPYVISVSGKASDGGVVLAIIGLSAISAPAVGMFADRYHAHRPVLVLGLLATAVSYALYAWSTLDQTDHALIAVIFGIGIAAIQSVGPAFIVAAGLPASLQAKRLAAYNLLTSVGLLLAGLLLFIVSSWTYGQKFLLAAGIITALTLVVWWATAEPARQIRPRKPPVAAGEPGAAPGALSQIFRSRFGVLLLMLVFTGIGYNATIGQISNIMAHGFSYAPSTTSLLLGVSGLVNIGGFVVAGWWMARSDALTVVTAAQVTHLTGLLGLAILSAAAPSAAILAGAFMLCFYSGEPFGRIPQPVLAVHFSTLNASTATAWYIAFLAGSAAIGGVLAGVFAQVFSFNAVIWLAAAAFFVGLVVNVTGLWSTPRPRGGDQRGTGPGASHRPAAMADHVSPYEK